MTIPFADLLRKISARFLVKTPRETAAPELRPARAQKPSSHGLSKTVLPNTRRSSARPDPFLVAAGAPSIATPSLTLGPRKIVSAPRPVAPHARDLPPALAMALEPKIERAISLQLSDFIEQIPADYIKPIEVIDASRSVALKASEIEKGMPEQNPSISLPSLYQQVPEIFLRTVVPSDATRVPLPYAKVLEQFNNARVRSDQLREPRIPQLETPILQATIEDTERFGTEVEPLETSPLPPVPVEPATAETIASAEPEAVARETTRSTSPESPSPHPVISLNTTSAETLSKKILPASTTAPLQAPPAPFAKVPFQFPPNGTGAPASERVPASSGPPVPTISESPSEPARIPFYTPEEVVDPKISGAQEEPIAPSADALPFRPGEVPPGADESCERAVSSEPTITLGLKALLQNVPAFQLNGDPSAVAEDVRVQFPLALVEPQLITGRVVVPAKTFHEALPVAQRGLFNVDPAETPVALPLAEVLKNLPDGVLKMRHDQETNTSETDFETPFSIKAREDSERFRPTVAKALVNPRGTPGEPKIEIAAEEKVDGKQVVARACQLPAVKACEILFPDGLSLAGNFPSEVEADGLCALAPPLLQRINAHMSETRLGALDAMTLRSTQSAITFFMKPNICLAVLHSEAGALPAETQTQLAKLSEKLSRAFAQLETPHVDH